MQLDHELTQWKKQFQTRVNLWKIIKNFNVLKSFDFIWDLSIKVDGSITIEVIKITPTHLYYAEYKNCQGIDLNTGKHIFHGV